VSTQAAMLAIRRQPAVGGRPTVRTNAIWNLSGSIFYALCQWGLISVLAKMGGSTQIGEFALGLSISAPIFMFGNLQLRGIQTADARNEHAFHDYLGLRLVGCVLSLATAVFLVFILSSSMPVRLVVSAVALAKGVESISDIHQGVMQKHERMDLLAVSLFFKGFASLAAFALVFLLSHQVVLACLGMAAAQALTLCLYDIPRSLGCGARQIRVWKPVWRRKHIRRILKGAFPLGITMLLLSLQTNLPRLAIEKHLGIADLGIFAAITYFGAAGSMVINGVGGAAAPRLATYWCRGDLREFRRLLFNLASFALVLGAAGVMVSLLLGRELLRLLYGGEYALRADVLVWTMVATAISFLASIFGYAATSMGRFREQPIVLGGVTVVLLAMCRMLVPKHGLLGAAWAMSVSSALCLILYFCLVQKNVRPI
jgi:O-antigen/teichoic acid export membrane protein